MQVHIYSSQYPINTGRRRGGGNPLHALVYIHTKNDMNTDIGSSDCCDMAIGLGYNIHRVRLSHSLYVCNIFARLQQFSTQCT